MTTALPSEKVTVAAEAAGESASLRLTAPGDAVATRTPDVEGRLPAQFFGTFFGQASFAALVGVLVLGAFAFAFASPRGAWLKGRLEPTSTPAGVR